MDDQKDPLPRKLAAIFFADVVGYSALANEDEEGTHHQLRTSLDWLKGLIEEHGGRVVSFAGDSVLGGLSNGKRGLVLRP